VPGRTLARIGGTVALLCAAALVTVPVAHADVIPCGLLAPCPGPPVTPPAGSTPPPTTPAPGPLTGTFDGHLGVGRAVDVEVRRGAHVRFDIAFLAGRCSDGGRYSSEVGVKLTHPVAVSPAGTAAVTVTYGKAYTFNRQGRRVNGRETMAVRLSQVTSASATVQFHDTFRSGRFHCDGGVLAVSAYPLGSAQAPLKDGAASSGNYRGSVVLRAGHLTRREGVRVSVYLPWGVMTDTRFSWVLDCGGHTTIETSELGPMLIHRAGGVDTFGSSGRGTIHFRGGIRGNYSYALRGQLSTGRSAWLGWTYNEDDYRGSTYLGSCAANESLTGSLLRG
jgi:hypothetical protein